MADAVAGEFVKIGIERCASGDFDGGAAAFSRALQIDASLQWAAELLVSALRRGGRDEDALLVALELVESFPGSAELWHHAAGLFVARKQYEGAELAYRRVLAIDPSRAVAWTNLGVALRARGRVDEAIACHERAVIVEPSHANAWTNLGNVLAWCGRVDEGLAACARAAELMPTEVEILGNLGNALTKAGRVAQAIEVFDSAVTMAPDHAPTRFNLALALLAAGEFERGFREYDWRWRRPGLRAPGWFEQSWDGRDLAGGLLLVEEEQGFGDTLQFVRFAPLVAERGARMVLRCRPRLAELLATAPGLELVTRDEPAPEPAARAMLMSLPGILGLTSIPSMSPYLSAAPHRIEHWREALPAGGLRVGICWQGSKGYEADQLRSPPLAHFGALARVPGVRLYSLQRGEGTEQLASVPFDVVDFGNKLDHGASAFVDTAAVMHHLDLVVTSDTSIAHLAGALGRPVWVVLPYTADWRWLIGTERSPWYPTMRLFRQATPRDWESAFAEVARALR